MVKQLKLDLSHDYSVHTKSPGKENDILLEIHNGECPLCAVTYGSEGLKQNSGMIPSLSVPHRTASLHQGHFSPRCSRAAE